MRKVGFEVSSSTVEVVVSYRSIDDVLLVIKSRTDSFLATVRYAQADRCWCLQEAGKGNI